MTGFVFLDKDENMTSFTLAKRTGRIFGEKKAGHTGTLDPMATGVMVVALGGATRFIELICSHDKSYKAAFLLGKTTDTLDITGTVLSERQVKAKKEDVERVLSAFTGEISQLPPMYSAIKKDGIRLYELARKGIEIEREERKVTIHSLSLTKADENNNQYEIEVSCSSGTYIRSLISDIGEMLSCGAVMTSLRRTKANGIPVENCYTLSELEALKEKGELSKALIKVDSFISYPKIRVTAPQAKRFHNGGALDANRFGGKKETGLYNVYSPEGEFLGIGEIDERKTELSVKRVYVPGTEMLSGSKKGTAVALGYFDGIHIGHKAVLSKALSLAKERNLRAVVLAFDIHPRKALHGDIPPILMSERLKRQALEEMGFEVIDFDFLKAMNYSPEEFAEKILLDTLGAKVLSCGEDYRYGKGGKGTAQTLKEYLSDKGTEVITVPDVSYGNEKVSSTKIREYIGNGEIEKANGMLGFYYSYDFTVEKGDGLGRGFGFPTINQFFPKDYVVPKYGVYASQVTLDGKVYPAVTNVGTRPTVCGKDLRSETCILDFDGNLYGNNIKVSLIKYLRGEKKFSDIDELKKAIEKDIEVSRNLFKRNDTNE